MCRAIHKLVIAYECLMFVAALAFAVCLSACVLVLGGLTASGLSLILLRLLRGQSWVASYQPWEEWFLAVGFLACVCLGMAKVFQSPEIRSLLRRIKFRFRDLREHRTEASHV